MSKFLRKSKDCFCFLHNGTDANYYAQVFRDPKY